MQCAVYSSPFDAETDLMGVQSGAHGEVYTMLSWITERIVASRFKPANGL